MHARLRSRAPGSATRQTTAAGEGRCSAPGYPRTKAGTRRNRANGRANSGSSRCKQLQRNPCRAGIPPQRAFGRHRHFPGTTARPAVGSVCEGQKLVASIGCSHDSATPADPRRIPHPYRRRISLPVRIGLLAMSLWPWFFGHPANSRKWEYDSQRSLENIRRKTPWRVRGEGEIFGACLSSELPSVRR